MVRRVLQDLLARQDRLDQLGAKDPLVRLVRLAVLQALRVQREIWDQPVRQEPHQLWLGLPVQLERKAMLAQQDRPDQPEIKV